MKRRPFVVGAAIALVALLVAGAIFLVRQTALAPRRSPRCSPRPARSTGRRGEGGPASRSAPSRRSSRWERRPGSACTTGRPDPGRRQSGRRRAQPDLGPLCAVNPAYKHNGGPLMADGATIPLERTAVPSEWDEVKTQLTRLADELGPKAGESRAVFRHLGVPSSSTVRLMRWTATGEVALDARAVVGCEPHPRRRQRQHRRHHQEPSGSGHRAENSSTQIVQFQNRLATLTSVIDDNSSGSRQRAEHAVVGGRRHQTVRGRLSPTGQRPGPDARQCDPGVGQPEDGPGETSCTSHPTPSPTATTSTTRCTATTPARSRCRTCRIRCTSSAGRSVRSRTSPRLRRPSCARSTSARRCGC